MQNLMHEKKLLLEGKEKDEISTKKLIDKNNLIKTSLSKTEVECQLLKQEKIKLNDETEKLRNKDRERGYEIIGL